MAHAVSSTTAIGRCYNVPYKSHGGGNFSFLLVQSERSKRVHQAQVVVRASVSTRKL